VAVELDTDAELLLWLAPDWRAPHTWLGPLSTYLRVAHPRGSTCLCLATGDERQEAVAARVGTACERLAGDIPFADVLIVPGPPAGSTVATAADVLAALGAPPPATPQSAEDAALARALAAELGGAPEALEDVRRLVPYA
jgi:hypothetical protein